MKWDLGFSISASIIKWRFILKLKIGCAKACDAPSRTSLKTPGLMGEMKCEQMVATAQDVRGGRQV